VAATFLGKEEGRRAPGEDEERWSVGRGEDEEEHFFSFSFRHLLQALWGLGHSSPVF
jgi:hypothetical protein